MAEARRCALLALALVASGCRAGRMRAGINLSSESSDYSPVARLAVALEPEVAADTPGNGMRRDAVARRALVVRVDSGTIEAPGTPRPGAPAIMRELELRALLVRFDAAPVANEDEGGGAARPWTALAASDPLPVLDSLHYGERLPIAPLRFEIPPTDSAAPGRATGIVFEITAAAVTEPVRMADGTVLPGRVIPRAVRVYACSPFTVEGRRDRRRERALARRYTAVC